MELCSRLHYTCGHICGHIYIYIHICTYIYIYIYKNLYLKLGLHSRARAREWWWCWPLPTSISNVSELLNTELKETNDWLSLNKLTLNARKTTFMMFHTYQTDITGLIPMLKINDVEIARCSSFICLGILFDENMSWKCHTDMISNKLLKYMGMLNKLKHYRPPYSLRIL